MTPRKSSKKASKEGQPDVPTGEAGETATTSQRIITQEPSSAGPSGEGSRSSGRLRRHGSRISERLAKVATQTQALMTRSGSSSRSLSSLLGFGKTSPGREEGVAQTQKVAKGKGRFTDSRPDVQGSNREDDALQQEADLSRASPQKKLAAPAPARVEALRREGRLPLYLNLKTVQTNTMRRRNDLAPGVEAIHVYLGQARRLPTSALAATFTKKRGASNYSPSNSAWRLLSTSEGWETAHDWTLQWRCKASCRDTYAWLRTLIAGLFFGYHAAGDAHLTAVRVQLGWLEEWQNLGTLVEEEADGTALVQLSELPAESPFLDNLFESGVREQYWELLGDDIVPMHPKDLVGSIRKSGPRVDFQERAKQRTKIVAAMAASSIATTSKDADGSWNNFDPMAHQVAHIVHAVRALAFRQLMLVRDHVGQDLPSVGLGHTVNALSLPENLHREFDHKELAFMPRPNAGFQADGQARDPAEQWRGAPQGPQVSSSRLAEEVEPVGLTEEGTLALESIDARTWVIPDQSNRSGAMSRHWDEFGPWAANLHYAFVARAVGRDGLLHDEVLDWICWAAQPFVEESLELSAVKNASRAPSEAGSRPETAQNDDDDGQLADAEGIPASDVVNSIHLWQRSMQDVDQDDVVTEEPRMSAGDETFLLDAVGVSPSDDAEASASDLEAVTGTTSGIKRGAVERQSEEKHRSEHSMTPEDEGALAERNKRLRTA